MTNEKAIILNTVCSALEAEYFKSDSKFEIPKTLFYAISKNISKTKGVVAENTELNGTIEKLFKKEVEFDETNKEDSYIKEIDKKYKEYFQTDEVIEQRKAFLEAESNVELHKVKKEALEGVIIPSVYLEIIEELIVE